MIGLRRSCPSLRCFLRRPFLVLLCVRLHSFILCWQAPGHCAQRNPSAIWGMAAITQALRLRIARVVSRSMLALRHGRGGLVAESRGGPSRRVSFPFIFTYLSARAGNGAVDCYARSEACASRAQGATCGPRPSALGAQPLSAGALWTGRLAAVPRVAGARAVADRALRYPLRAAESGAR